MTPKRKRIFWIIAKITIVVIVLSLTVSMSWLGPPDDPDPPYTPNQGEMTATITETEPHIIPIFDDWFVWWANPDNASTLCGNITVTFKRSGDPGIITSPVPYISFELIGTYTNTTSNQTREIVAVDQKGEYEIYFTDEAKNQTIQDTDYAVCVYDPGTYKYTIEMHLDNDTLNIMERFHSTSISIEIIYPPNRYEGYDVITPYIIIERRP